MATRSLNRVTLIGNLTREPKVRFTPSGSQVCSFGLATNRTWSNPSSGEKQEQVEFHNIVAWGKLADICAQYLHTGDKAYVEGRIQSNDWETEDGQKRKSTEIVIDNMIMLSTKSGGKGSGSKAEYNSADDDEGPMPDEDAGSASDVSDEIPF